MKQRKFGIFRRISILVFTLITGLCLLFMAITYLSTTHFHQASTQLLNKDVAAHIAKFTSPFENNGINKKKADSVFYDAMVISPSAEVYFLDTTGKVIAFHAPENDIKLWKLPLTNIKELIASKGEEYITGPDPKEPFNPKIFSAAEVENNNAQKIGYIYVILGSNKNVSTLLYTNYLGNLLIKAFCVILALSIIFSFFYLNRIQRSFNRMLGVLDKFQNGDFEARFQIKEQDELAPITQAFNKMADLLVYNINRLKKSEKERKDFIANISHDLRTPLSVARGYTETLLIKKKTQDASPGESEEYVQLILRKVCQVEHMVKQLFELSKMESAEFIPQKEPFVFSEILQEAIHASAQTASEKNIVIDCGHCCNASWIYADIGMMERVVQNLLVNAIKYTPENGLIQIALEKENEGLIFQIKNTGQPLDVGLLKWFNAPDETDGTANRPSGSGFGLVIVKKILHLHQYFFKAYASPAEGNSFIIRMPEHHV